MPEPAPTQAALSGIDRLLGHRIRFAICALLSRNERLSFSRLKALLDQTDGSLGAQLRKLEDAGYLSVRKRFENRRPVSWYAITDAGRTALDAHLAALRALIDGPAT